MNINASDISYFLEVAQSGNISRAAERLGISQPSLSIAMKRLESNFDTDLMVRSRKGVQLTRAGQELAQRGRSFLNEWRQIHAQVLQQKNTTSGLYNIGCHTSVALYTLPLFLPQLLSDYPDLNIRLKHDLSRKITEEVISDKVDFGIVVNPVPHPDLVIKELAQDTVSFWVSEELAGKEDLDLPLICDQDLLQAQDLIKKWTKKGSMFRRIVHSSDLQVITNLTSTGAGIGLLPKRVATRNSDDKLVPWKKDAPLFKDRICLIYKPELQRSSASKLIIETIRSIEI